MGVEWKLFRLFNCTTTTAFHLLVPLFRTSDELGSSACFREAAVIKAQRDSQDRSNLSTLERLNEHVSVICCPRVGEFSLHVFYLFISIIIYFSSGILTSNGRRQLERERISCLCRGYANVRRWSLWSRTARLPDRTIIDGGGKYSSYKKSE